MGLKVASTKGDTGERSYSVSMAEISRRQRSIHAAYL